MKRFLIILLANVLRCESGRIEDRFPVSNSNILLVYVKYLVYSFWLEHSISNVERRAIWCSWNKQLGKCYSRIEDSFWLRGSRGTVPVLRLDICQSAYENCSMWGQLDLWELVADSESLRKRVSQVFRPKSVRNSNIQAFSAVSVELRFGLTHRNRFEQRIYGSQFVQNTEVDIALIKLKTDVQLTSLVKTALLPRISQKNELFENHLATVCGFGVENQQTGEISTFLKFTELKILSQNDCKPYFGNVDIRILCAKSMNSLSSTCPGKSFVLSSVYFAIKTR